MLTIKKILSVSLAMLLLLGALAGCTTQTNPPAATATATAAPAATSQAGTSAPDAGQITPVTDLPIVSEPITLTYFITINSAMSATMSTYAEVECMKLMEEITGIKVEFTHPSSTGASEQFSLMLASDKLPDMINWPLGNAKGGPTALLRDGKIVELTDELLYTYASNYMRIMDNNPSYKRNTMLDDGTMFQFVNFNYDSANNKIAEFKIKGPYIRMDWVEKVGLEAPTTIDELYTVLTAFKEQDVNGKGNVIPFINDKSLTAIKAIAGSFGTRWSLHMQDGEIVYGPMTENFRTYLEYMAKWYSEGLINSDFPVLENWGAAMLSSDAGFTIASMGSGLTMQREALLETDPESNLDSIAYLIGPGGHQSLVDDSGANPRATAITTSNQHVEETIRWIDYAYSPEGSMLTTFGIEGVSYEMIDGYPTLTELVMNNTWGINQEEAIAKYALGPINYPNARDIRFYEQVNLNSEQKQRIQTNWQTGTSDILIPPVALTVDENTQYSNVMSDINTYANETIVNFIIGKEPLENFDKFVSNIEGMGIEKAIQIYSDAVERFNQR